MLSYQFMLWGYLINDYDSYHLTNLLPLMVGWIAHIMNKTKHIRDYTQDSVRGESNEWLQVYFKRWWKDLLEFAWIIAETIGIKLNCVCRRREHGSCVGVLNRETRKYSIRIELHWKINTLIILTISGYTQDHFHLH